MDTNYWVDRKTSGISSFLHGEDAVCFCIDSTRTAITTLELGFRYWKEDWVGSVGGSLCFGGYYPVVRSFGGTL